MNALVFALSLIAFPAFADSVTAGGIYWVPTEPSLSQFAVFELGGVRIDRDDQRTRVRYTLPRELTGAENAIDLRGPAGVPGKPLVLEGDKARAECPNADLARCSIVYHGIVFDQDLRNQVLTKLSTSPEELTSRQFVAASFQEGGEPHGFLHVLGSQKGY